jgi:DNA modification methylase
VRPPQYQLIAGDGADLAIVGTGEADLIVTSPPYFADATEALLRRPVAEQTEPDRVRREVAAFALTLRPVFAEMARVLRPGGALVLQTKDLRYGRALVELAGIHRELAEATGLTLATKVYWHKVVARGAPSSAFRRAPLVGSFRADDVEEFLVFGHAGGIERRRARVDLPPEELAACAAPVWRWPPLGNARAHPYQSPPRLVRRFFALYSAPGDLVVDPFAGHGTTLKEAVAMGRRAIGYEIDQARAAAADRSVARALPGVPGVRP